MNIFDKTVGLLFSLLTVAVFFVLCLISYPYIAPLLIHLPAWKGFIGGLVSLLHILQIIGEVIAAIAIAITVLLLAPHLIQLYALAMIKVTEAKLKWQEVSLEIARRRNELQPFEIGATGTSLYNPFSREMMHLAPLASLDGKKVDQIKNAYVPTLLELFKGGELANDEIPIGIDGNNKLLKYSVTNEVSGFILGRAGSGKSVTLTVKIIVALKLGANVTLLDPHFNDPDQSTIARLGPIAAYCYCTTGDEMIDAVKQFYQEYLDRKTVRVKPPYGWELSYLIVDELSDLLDNEGMEEIAEIIGKIAREARKFNMFVKVGTQLAQAQYIGGTQLRKSQPETIIHESDASEAELLLGKTVGSKKVLASCPDLPQGKAYYKGQKVKYELVSIPFVRPDELEQLAEIIRHSQTREVY